MNLGKETEKIEFKKSTSELKQAMNSMSAILNKHGDGVLYFGVLDSGEVIGQQIGKETERDISTKINQSIDPRPNYIIHHERNDGLDYIKVTFNGNDRPYSSDGRFYLRFSDQDMVQNRNELALLFARSERDYSTWENELTEFGLLNIDEERVRAEYNQGLLRKRIVEPYTTLENALTKFGLIINGKITQAGIHLFGNNGPINYAMSTYASSEKTTILDMEHIKGNIFDCIDKGFNYVSRNIRWKAEIKGIIREDIPEIPAPLFRELIVNSFAHAKYYQILSGHALNVFSDRVLIFNPGSFPIDFEPRDYIEKSINPVRRNLKIIEVLHRTGRMESETYGLRTVYRLAKENELPLKYSLLPHGVEFNIYRPVLIIKDGSIKSVKLTKNEIRVLELLKEDPHLTSSEIAEILNVSRKTITRVNKSLKDLNRIERVGSNYDGYWRILE